MLKRVLKEGELVMELYFNEVLYKQAEKRSVLGILIHVPALKMARFYAVDYDSLDKAVEVSKKRYDKDCRRIHEYYDFPSTTPSYLPKVDIEDGNYLDRRSELVADNEMELGVVGYYDVVDYNALSQKITTMVQNYTNHDNFSNMA